jgi:hypothetical protein
MTIDSVASRVQLASEMQCALWGGDLDRIWERINAGEKIPGLTRNGGDSNLRIIIEKCPDLTLIRHVLQSITTEEILAGTILHSALSQAAKRNNAPIVELLLKAKADVNLSDPDGNTALHDTAVYDLTTPYIHEERMQDVSQRAVQTASLLLQAGASIDCTNHKGETPLHKCMNERASHMNPALITFLVSEGATPIALESSPEILSKVNQAVQHGLQIRRQVVTQALKLPDPIAALVSQYI